MTTVSLARVRRGHLMSRLLTLESCSSDENQDIEVMFNKQYTHNIKFTGFGDYLSLIHI